MFTSKVASRVGATAVRRAAVVVPRQAQAAAAWRSAAAAPAMAVTRRFASYEAEVTVSAAGDRYVIRVPEIDGKDGFVLSVGANDTVKQFTGDLSEQHPVDGVFSSNSKVSSSFRMSDLLERGSEVFLAGRKHTLTIGSQHALSHAIALTHNLPSRTELDKLKADFIPLFKQKRELDTKAEKRANMIVWGGMAYLVCQWTFMARLTWWEFNWDIMEPVTYFVSFGTAVLGYAYFAIQKTDYSYDHLRGITISKRMFKNYVRNDFPIDQYFALEHKIHKAHPELLAEIEYDLEQEEYEKKTGVAGAASTEAKGTSKV